MLEIFKKHKDVYYFFDKSSIKINLSEEYKHQLLKQIKALRIESYFNYIIRLIYQEDYKKKGLKVEVSELFELYNETVSKILKDNARIILDSSINPYEELYTSFGWEAHHSNYGKELELIIDTILNVINYDKEIKRVLGLSENENPYNSMKAHQFVQALITIGYSQATQRIKDEIDNDNYLGIEFIKDKEDEELLIYLTPKGMVEVSELFNNIDEKDREQYFTKLLNYIGIQKIKNNHLENLCKTSDILVFNNKIYCHYKQINLSYNNFFNKRINKQHMYSIILETQSNYKLVK